MPGCISDIRRIFSVLLLPAVMIFPVPGCDDGSGDGNRDSEPAQGADSGTAQDGEDAGSDSDSDVDRNLVCTDQAVLDEVMISSLDQWEKSGTSANPYCTYAEISEGYKNSNAVRFTCSSTSDENCAEKLLSKDYNVDNGNSSTTLLEMLFNASADPANSSGSYVIVTLLNETDQDLGHLAFYQPGTLGSDVPAASSHEFNDFDDASSAEFHRIGLYHIGDGIEFSKIRISLGIFACPGKNTIVFDNLVFHTGCSEPG